MLKVGMYFTYDADIFFKITNENFLFISFTMTIFII